MNMHYFLVDSYKGEFVAFGNESAIRCGVPCTVESNDENMKIVSTIAFYRAGLLRPSDPLEDTIYSQPAPAAQSLSTSAETI